MLRQIIINGGGRKAAQPSGQECHSLLDDSPTLQRVFGLRQFPLWYNLLWAVALGSCWALSAYQVQDRVRFYLSEPVATAVGVVRNQTLVYPRLTVCGYSSLASSEFARNLFSLVECPPNSTSCQRSAPFEKIARWGSRVAHQITGRKMTVVELREMASVRKDFKCQFEVDNPEKTPSCNVSWIATTKVSAGVCGTFSLDGPMPGFGQKVFRLVSRSALVLIHQNPYDLMGLRWVSESETFPYQRNTEITVKLTTVKQFECLPT